MREYYSTVCAMQIRNRQALLARYTKTALLASLVLCDGDALAGMSKECVADARVDVVLQRERW